MKTTTRNMGYKPINIKRSNRVTEKDAQNVLLAYTALIVIIFGLALVSLILS